MAFTSEQALSRAFIDYLNSQNTEDNASITLVFEPKRLFGIPDIVLVINEYNDYKFNVALELKLSKWNKALKQAFKYKTFAHLSFVLLDDNYVKPAINNIERFINANIGLISLDENGNFYIYHTPYYETPYFPILEQELLNQIEGNNVLEVDINFITGYNN